MPSRKREFQKCVRLAKAQELLVCRRHREFPAASYTELARWVCAQFNLFKIPSKQVIWRVVKGESSLRKLTPDCLKRKKRRRPYQLLLDQSVVEFVMACEMMQLSLSGRMLIAQARKLAHRLSIPSSSQPRFGQSWLRNLQDQYGIRWKRAYGESGAVDLEEVASDFQRLWCLIGQYSSKNVYNMDETGFYYNNVPSSSLCFNEAPSLKKDKARITLALCCNATGSDKRSLLFIGNAAKPRWIKSKPGDVDYKATKKAWMTTDVYQTWLEELDKTMRAESRKILLLVDNASSHCEDGLHLTNVRVEMLPPNTTSELQPLDQGIIYCVKRSVLNKKMDFALDQIDNGFDDNPYKVGMQRGVRTRGGSYRRRR